MVGLGLMETEYAPFTPEGLESVPAGWKEALEEALAEPNIDALSAFLAERQAAGVRIYPPASAYLRALELTPLEAVRVVILGQDPYHGQGQAHGLSFSVQPGVRPPGSLKNIYAEIERDLGITPAPHGFLETWARQGVLLLNTVLTVEEGQAGSHNRKGWEPFTDAIIRAVNAKDTPVVFLLWGQEARKKAALIDDVGRGGRHLVLETSHPSGLSAWQGFRGCGHFSKTNRFLESQGLAPIDWSLPPSP
jgi:uracil-DNA glycosylase